MVSNAFRIFGLAAVVAAGLCGGAVASPWSQVSNDGTVSGNVPDVTASQWKSAAGSGPAERSIFGSDSRKVVGDTTTYPARTTALITFRQDGKLARCTGFFISADTVATAGQCVHGGGEKGKWTKLDSVEVIPGADGHKNGKIVAPFGSCGAVRLYSVEAWVNDKEEQYDYGAIKLDCDMGKTVGWLGAYFTTASLTGKTVATNAYPGDLRMKQVSALGPIKKTSDRTLSHKVDTTTGMDGGALYLSRSGCGRCAVAINTARSKGDSKYNIGTRINERVFNNLYAWRQ